MANNDNYIHKSGSEKRKAKAEAELRKTAKQLKKIHEFFPPAHREVDMANHTICSTGKFSFKIINIKF
jgi:uncharacterized protein YgiM (DUF1202 family)